MDAAEVRNKLGNQAGRFGQLGVRSLSLFGSVARGDAGRDADLDFLVEFEGPATFDRYMALKELLEAEFRHRIDLVTVRALKPALRDQIIREAVKVA
jgi:predicted nucleotidyltransferase